MRSRLRDYAVTLVFLLIAAWLVIRYVQATPYTTRVHDLNGHLEHIDYIYERHLVPPTKKCWQCYQPPAYYALAAATLAATRAEPSENRDVIGCVDIARPNARTLQWLSAVLAFGAFAFSLLAVRGVLASTYERIVASALVVFWPTFVIEACKIGNDVLFYFFTSATLWLLVVWQRSGRALHLLLAAQAAAFAINAKLNGAVAVALVATMMALHVVRPRPGEPRVPRGTVPAVASLLTGIAAMVYTVVKLKQGSTTNADAERVLADQAVPNHLANFVSLDLETFWKTPWPYQTESGVGREYFWNYLFRVSLFGEYRHGSPALELTANILLVITAGLLLYAIVGLVVMARDAWRGSDGGRMTMIVALAGLLGFALTIRARYPYISSNDFRYVLPVVVPASTMAAAGAAAVRRRVGKKHLHAAALAGALVTLFCLASLKIVFDWK